MRGPIDYIVVGFEGNKFDGSILKALEDAIKNGVIDLIALEVITKDKKGEVTTLSIADLGDSYVVELVKSRAKDKKYVTSDDINEVAELLENNTAAGLLVVEQLWAKPLKKALLDANGVLVAEGRIHPEAAAELDNEGGI